VGKTKYPTYRLIVSEKTRDTCDKYVELLGTFNPHIENGFLPKPIVSNIGWKKVLYRLRLYTIYC